MDDKNIIKKLCAEFRIKLNEVDSYSWDQVGYVLSTEGRVEVLNLHAQEINKLPEYINTLSDLRVLHVVGNQIGEIQEISNLKKLEILAIQANKICDISVIENFKNLKELYLSHNPVKNLKPLKGLKNLTKLEIELEDTVDCSPISSLVNLESLTLSEKEIKNPIFLLNCTKLFELGIWGTLHAKTELSDQVCEYIEKLKLTTLIISGFKSINLERIVKLSQLRVLWIIQSDLTNTDVISKMKQLEELFLSSNDIKSVRGLSNLSQLQKLDLSYNRIENIAAIKKLHFLKSINIRETLITDLAPLLDFGMKFVYDESNEQYEPNENEILISGCKYITNPPIEIVKQGNEAIKRYFRKIEQEGFDYIFEAKLILVGEGSAGKTSLQRRLVSEDASLPEGENRTRGIEVTDFEFGTDKLHKTVHVWDFGGQDVYYPVHRFFITENSVFVLLASTRQPFHNFDYWIPTIFQFGGKSPIIIGQTCHQGNTTPWNELDLYLSNPNFNIIKTLEVPYYKIDLPDNNAGLNVVKDVILNQIENLHHFGKGVPKSWITIRSLLLEESQTKSCIPFQTFIELCRQFKNFENIRDVEDCCRFFHDIGVILWYSQIEELKDWVILEPEWAMNAVYQIIDDTEIQTRNGVIQPNDFIRLWNSKLYEGKYSLLKRLLVNFKIAFPTKHSDGEYIIPARLASIPNEMKWGLEENCLRLEYQFEFMPRGLVNQLSAELSRYIFRYQVWNNAVNLAYENNDTRSQVIEDSYNRKLSIVSKGIDARGMNILIMNAMRNIIDSYKGVKEEIYVKCPCKTCQKLEKPTTFLYTKLMEWSLKRNEGTVTCNESGENLKIAELLYSIGFGAPSKKENSLVKHKIITIFLASSQELEGDRKEFEIFINRENKQLVDDNIFLKLEVWEDFFDCMSKTRLQDEYNSTAIKSDIFISLFWTKVGKYTAEEFNKAWGNFKENGKPAIYTYFNNTPVNPNDIKEEDITSKFKFLKELKELGHYQTTYENIDDLKYKFKMQLQKILPKIIGGIK